MLKTGKYGRIAFMLCLASAACAVVCSLSWPQDEALVAPNGLGFDRIKGYEDWQLIAAHARTDKKEIRYILGNDAAVRSYLSGAGNGTEKFAEGAVLVKVKYAAEASAEWKESVEPGRLAAVEYMVKDSKAFPETDGWGYAPFPWDAATGKFKAGGDGPKFHHACHACHLEKVKARDFVFTRPRHPKFGHAWTSSGSEAGGPVESPAGGAGGLKGGAPKADGAIAEGEYGSKTILGNGVMTIHVGVDKEFLRIGIEARTKGWVALGIEPTEFMNEADMIVGWVGSDGKAQVEDQWCGGKFDPHARDDTLGGKDSFLERGGSEKDGVTVIEIKRLLDTGDKYDKPVPATGKFRFIWAMGSSDDPASQHERRGDGKAGVLAPPGAGPDAPRRRPSWPGHAMLMGLATVFLISAIAVAMRRGGDFEWLGKHKTLGIVVLMVLSAGVFSAHYMSVSGHLKSVHGVIGAVSAGLGMLTPVLGFAMTKIRGASRALRPAHVWCGRLAAAALVLSCMLGISKFV